MSYDCDIVKNLCEVNLALFSVVLGKRSFVITPQNNAEVMFFSDIQVIERFIKYPGGERSAKRGWSELNLPTWIFRVSKTSYSCHFQHNILASIKYNKII